MNFYKCSECQSIAMELVAGSPGHEKKFQELAANTADASGEKHVPVITNKGGKVQVKVGELEHPMLPEHYIMWIFLETEQGGHLRLLSPGDKPEAEFTLDDGDKAVAVYEYCNLHGLWKGGC